MLYKYETEEASILDRYLANLSIEVEPFALCMLDAGWRLTLPGPPCAMLHFVVRGEGWLSCPDGTHKPIGPNWVIVIPTGTVHSLETEEQFDHELKIDCAPSGPPVHYILAGDDGPVEMVVGCGTLNVRYGEALGLFDHLSELLVIDLNGVEEVPGLFQVLMREQANNGPGKPILQGAIMTQLLVHMLRALAEQSESSLAWLNALDDPRLARVIDHILEDPAAPHSVESLAEVAHMSRSSFSRHFHDAFSKSPMSLVNHVRLERAAKMLYAGRYPIEQIGSRVGFSSRSHFSQAFKKHTGHSPAEFRDGMPG
jgi:AraC family transcriptional activator of mtrCDE